ncbi:MAG: DUF3419 family protein [bacterium]
MRGQSIRERACFDLIRYANCWEDADILLAGLKVKQGGKYISIASAGDNSLAMLSARPSLVLAIDINPVQLACVEIRKAAFKTLDYEDLLVFMGVKKSQDRIALYHRLKESLPAEARLFWEKNIALITHGLIHSGKFENYFQLFRKFVLPLIHSKKNIDYLLSISDVEERKKFYSNTWANRRWKLLFKIFFSKAFMGRLGRDPEFFKYVEDDVAKNILKRAEYALTVLPTDKNPYLEYILRGNFENNLPYYLRRENYQAIRDNLDKLIIYKGDLRQALSSCQNKFDGFNLSDIFEYMSPGEYHDELLNIQANAASGSRLVYWNMLANRKETEGLAGKMRFLDDEAVRLFSQDKAFFYKCLIIGETV